MARARASGTHSTQLWVTLGRAPLIPHLCDEAYTRRYGYGPLSIRMRWIPYACGLSLMPWGWTPYHLRLSMATATLGWGNGFITRILKRNTALVPPTAQARTRHTPLRLPEIHHQGAGGENQRLTRP
jgi:hypothetical protein